VTYRALAAAALTIGFLHAQPELSFAVASIKPNPNCEIGSRPSGITPDRLELHCMSLRGLIRIAYGDFLAGGNLPTRRIGVVGGPGWLDSERYDVSAKAEGGATREQATGPMLQRLLEERCRLKVHHEARESAVYLMTVASNGPKLQVAKEGGCVPVDLSNLFAIPAKPGDAQPKYCGLGGSNFSGSGRASMDWYGTSMAEVAGRMLAGRLDYPVVDKTGLTGHYDIHLEFVPQPPSGPIFLNGVPTTAVPNNDTGGASIFAALEEQLGLKLTPGKSPLDVIIVDHAEKPSAN
jgi:uncharacterized protein (TIGR03435 family)